MASVDEILGQLDKETRNRALVASDVSPERLATPSIGLTAALKGGWGFGRQVMIWGTKSAGKSSFLMEQFGLAQQEGKVCAYLDVEGTFESSWASRLGVDTDTLLLFQDKSVERVANTVTALMRANVDVIAIDSITSLMPAAYMEGDELKSMEQMGRIGALASDMSKMMPMLSYANRNSMLFVVSQARQTQKGSMYWGLGPTGGEAVKFYSTQVVSLWSSESGVNTRDGIVRSGDMLVKKPIARRVVWTVEYNKLGPQGGKGSYWFQYETDDVGIRRIEELLDVATESGVIEKSGSWYKYDGENIGQGPEKAAQHLIDNPDLVDAIKDKL